MRFWISWEEPVDDTGDWRPLHIPVPEEIKNYWCSGYGDDYATICAVVDADNEAAAKDLVYQEWRPQKWRFCEEQAVDWRPDPGRFPWTKEEEEAALALLKELSK